MRFPRVMVVALAVGLSSACTRGSKDVAPEKPAVPEKPATQPPPGSSWTAFAGDHGAILEQKGLDATTCKVTCTLRNDTVAWSLDTCIGTEDDLRFVALDCSAAFVIDPYPEIQQNWAHTTVVRVWNKTGLAQQLKAVQFVTEGDEIKVLNGEVGIGPRYGDGGKSLELDTLDDRHHAVPLAAMAEGKTSAR
jgi:hypothetical protein